MSDADERLNEQNDNFPYTMYNTIFVELSMKNIYVHKGEDIKCLGIVWLSRMNPFDAVSDHWEQYDGIMKPNIDKDLLTKGKEWFQKKFKSGIYKDAKHAETGLTFQSMLPTWEGFCLEIPQHDQTAQQALDQIDQVLRCIDHAFREEWMLLKDDKNMRNQVRLDAIVKGVRGVLMCPCCFVGFWLALHCYCTGELLSWHGYLSSILCSLLSVAVICL